MAWAIAIAADVLQIVAFPFFVEGGMSPADSVLDLIVAFVMIRLLGWHWAFLPYVGGETHPRRRPFSHLDRCRMVRYPPEGECNSEDSDNSDSNSSFQRRGDSAAGSRARTAPLKTDG